MKEYELILGKARTAIIGYSMTEHANNKQTGNEV